MSYADRRIVEAYSGLLEGLSTSGKKELLEHLANSLNGAQKDRDAAFYRSFGAFASTQTAEEIIQDIKSARNFREKDVSL